MRMKIDNMIIDIHAHTSKHLLKSLHTKNADISDIEHYAKTFGIDRIYLMATYFPLKKSGLTNFDLLERVKDNKLFGCFGSINLENNIDEGIKELDSLAKDDLIEGIKLYPGYQNIDISSSLLYPIIWTAARYQLPIAIHMGELHHCCPRDSINKCGNIKCELDNRKYLSHPIQLLKLAKTFQGINFIASHLGNPFFETLKLIMKDCHNVYTDISGQFISGSYEDTSEYKEYIIKQIKSFIEIDGAIERIMFGTDFPIQSYKDSLKLISDLGLSKEKENMILSGNAKRILRYYND